MAPVPHVIRYLRSPTTRHNKYAILCAQGVIVMPSLIPVLTLVCLTVLTLSLILLFLLLGRDADDDGD